LVASATGADGCQLVGLGYGKLRVLSDNIDPLSICRKEEFYEAGRWFRDRMEAAGLLRRSKPIHLRGFRYVLVSTTDWSDRMA
jgi:hypothetical protein